MPSKGQQPVPGELCGTSIRTFTAARPGTAMIEAGRDSCGEALRCLAGSDTFQMTVKVLGP